MRDDGDFGAQGVEVERRGGNAVVVDCALSEDAAEEREGQGALEVERGSTVNNIILGCFLASRWLAFPEPVRPTT